MSETTGTTDSIIDVTVGEGQIAFQISRTAYNKYINGLSPKNKTAPSRNFLINTVLPDDKAVLVALLNSAPGAEVELAGVVLDEYTPDLGFAAKKRSS